MGLGLKRRRKRVMAARPPRARAEATNQRWSMDFMADRLKDGRRFRVLTLVDHFSRVSPALAVGSSLTGRHVVELLEALPKARLPRVVQVDIGPVFVSRAPEAWAYRKKVAIDFSRPGRAHGQRPD